MRFFQILHNKSIYEIRNGASRVTQEWNRPQILVLTREFWRDFLDLLISQQHSIDVQPVGLRRYNFISKQEREVCAP